MMKAPVTTGSSADVQAAIVDSATAAHATHGGGRVDGPVRDFPGRGSFTAVERTVSSRRDHGLLEAALSQGMRWALLAFVFSVPAGALYLFRHHDLLGPTWPDLAPQFVSFFIVTGLLAGAAIRTALGISARLGGHAGTAMLAGAIAGAFVGWLPGGFAAGYFGGMDLPMWEPDMVAICVATPLLVMTYSMARHEGRNSRRSAIVGVAVPLVVVVVTLLPMLFGSLDLTAYDLDVLREGVIEIGLPLVGCALGLVLFAIHGAWCGIAVAIARGMS